MPGSLRGLVAAGRRRQRRRAEDRAMKGMLSVAIITKNEEHRIERCLQSVGFADQVVVVDSGSTAPLWRWRAASAPRSDRHRTGPASACRRIVRSRSAATPGPVDRRRRGSLRGIAAVDPGDRQWPGLAPGQWLLDRPQLALLRPDDPLRLWRNDRVLRLFRREGGRFTDDLVHERVICEEPLGRLTGVLYHDSVDSIEDAREKTFRYARAGAIQLRRRGKGGLWSAWTHGIWSFVRGYLLRLGFLDGRNGLILACLTARGTYWRYRWAWRDPKRRGVMAARQFAKTSSAARVSRTARAPRA